MIKKQNKILYSILFISILFCLSLQCDAAPVTPNPNVTGSGVTNPNITPNPSVPGSGFTGGYTSTAATPNINTVNPNSSSPYRNQEKIPGAEPTSEFVPYLKSIINFGFAIIGILALFMLIIGAYQYLMAAGSGKAEGAKETITSALLGLILGLCAWIILYKINPDLVEMRGITQITGGGTGIPGTTPGSTAPGTGTSIPTTYPTTAPAEIQQKAKAYAAKHGVPEAIAMRMLNAESGGNINAVSSKGASGLLQLMPGTARGLGVTNIFDVDQNLNAGYKYVSGLASQYNGNWEYAVAAYNMGPNGFNSFMAGKRNLPKETNGYVKKVMGGCSFCS